MTVRKVYLSNLLAAWPFKRQEELCAEMVPDWPDVSTYKDEAAPRHRKAHAVEALTERALLLRPTSRRHGRETVYIPTFGLLAWEWRDFLRCIKAAGERGATLVALDTGTQIPPDASPTALIAAAEEFATRRKSDQTKLGRDTGGGLIAGQRREEAAREKVREKVAPYWHLKSPPTKELLAVADVSYNTACKHMKMTRPEAQRKHELAQQQAERNRKRRKPQK